jgi:hypothetical protein
MRPRAIKDWHSFPNPNGRNQVPTNASQRFHPPSWVCSVLKKLFFESAFKDHLALQVPITVTR